MINWHAQYTYSECVCVYTDITCICYYHWFPLPHSRLCVLSNKITIIPPNSQRHKDYYLTHHFGMVYSMKIKGFLWFIQLIHIIHVCFLIWFTHQNERERERKLYIVYSVVYSFWLILIFIIHMWPIYQILYILRIETMTKKNTKSNFSMYCTFSLLYIYLWIYKYMYVFCLFLFCIRAKQKQIIVLITMACLACVWHFEMPLASVICIFHLNATKNQHYLYK